MRAGEIELAVEEGRRLLGVSSLRPDARVSAEMSLRRTSADVMATGIEPRVPQNLTFKRPSGGIERGERLGREPG
jgi:hypothetical protein